jgi:predicted N-acyltransferase
MVQDAEAHHAAMFVLRDVNREISSTISALHGTCTTLGFHRLPLFQQAWLTLSWSTFEDYLAALRARYRELVRRDLRKIQLAQCDSLVLPGSQARTYIPDLHRLWHQAYQKHRDRDQLLLPESISAKFWHCQPVVSFWFFDTGSS